MDDLAVELGFVFLVFFVALPAALLALTVLHPAARAWVGGLRILRVAKWRLSSGGGNAGASSAAEGIARLRARVVDERERLSGSGDPAMLAAADAPTAAAGAGPRWPGDTLGSLRSRMAERRAEWRRAAGWGSIDLHPLPAPLFAAEEESALEQAHAHKLQALEGAGGVHRLAFESRLAWLARQLGGQAVELESNVAGHVTWTWKGRRFYFYELPRQDGWWTFIATREEGSLLPTFQVCPRGGGRSPFGLLPDVWPEQTGVPRFDDGFEIRLPANLRTSESPVAARALGTYLRLQGSPWDVILEADGHRCRVGIFGLATLAAPFVGAVRIVCEMLDAALEPYAPEQPPALEVDVLRIEGEGLPVCRVCGEGLAGARVECARCGTPHHEDCWAYVGGCAIYACRGREARSAAELDRGTS